MSTPSHSFNGFLPLQCTLLLHLFHATLLHSSYYDLVYIVEDTPHNFHGMGVYFKCFTSITLPVRFWFIKMCRKCIRGGDTESTLPMWEVILSVQKCYISGNKCTFQYANEFAV